MRDLLQLLERSKQQEQFWTQASASSEKANWNSWAIRMEFEPISELRQFMGMMNQLGKFPKTQQIWPNLWGKQEFGVHWFSICKCKGKTDETNHTSPLQPASTNISVCWCIILQIRSCVDAEMPIWEEPVAYASRSMIDTEKRNAQIEKEALVTTWACEKFVTNILRMKFLIETVTNHLYPYWEQSILTVYLHEYFNFVCV